MSIAGTLFGEHNRPMGVDGEWQLVKTENHNSFQRVASYTDGWITPANIISAVGAGLTMKGLLDYSDGKKLRGVVEVGLGRTCDLADGWVAKKTGTRSTKGAVLDAGLDKYTTVASNICLFGNGMSATESIGMSALQIDIVHKSIEIDKRGGSPDPSTLGKIGMFATWCWVGSIMAEGAANEANMPKTEKTFGLIKQAIKPVAFGLTAKTAYDFRNRAKKLQASA